MRLLHLACIFLASSCSLLGINRDYTRPCEKLITELEKNKKLKVVKGHGQVISTDWNKHDNRNDSVGDHFFFERAKSDMLQELYRNRSKIDISPKDTVTLRNGKTSVTNNTNETAYLQTEKMVTVFCGGYVYGVVNKARFE